MRISRPYDDDDGMTKHCFLCSSVGVGVETGPAVKERTHRRIDFPFFLSFSLSFPLIYSFSAFFSFTSASLLLIPLDGSALLSFFLSPTQNFPALHSHSHLRSIIVTVIIKI